MLRLAFVAALAVACGKGDKAAKHEAAGSATTKPTDSCAGTHEKGPIRWFEDNWAGAVACAKQRNVPIVLDLWAPWCHTCIAMQTTVFMDRSFTAKADQFVFVALDADREVNAAPVGKYATTAMPTFYVIGHDEQVLARFVGAATVQQFHELMDAGARAAAGGIALADAKLQSAERALAAKDLATAEADLNDAIAAAPPRWPRLAMAVYSLQSTLKKRGNHLGCVYHSDAHRDAVGNDAIAANFWATAFECVTLASKAAPGEAVDPQKAKRVQELAIARLDAALTATDSPLSADDRAEALGYLRDALDAYGKKDAAKDVAEKLRTILDDAYAKAPTPFARMTFIWPRAEVYAWLERPLDLVSDYEKLAAELPKEYDVPARLGWLYFKAGKHVEAAAWTDKALALVYGPRKGRLYNQRAEIAAAAGDKTTERRMREHAVKHWESLPPGHQNPDQLAKAKDALAKLAMPIAAP